MGLLTDIVMEAVFGMHAVLFSSIVFKMEKQLFAKIMSTCVGVMVKFNEFSYELLLILQYFLNLAPRDYFLSQTSRNGSTARDLTPTITLFFKKITILKTSTSLIVWTWSKKSSKCKELKRGTFFLAKKLCFIQKLRTYWPAVVWRGTCLKFLLYVIYGSSF